MNQIIDRPSSITPERVKAQLAETGAQKPNGPPMAALLASGIGVTALGLLTTVAAASADFANLLKISPAVGPLSGKTIYSVAAFYGSWLVLGIVLRKQNVNERAYLVATFGLIALGVLGTFPIFFDLFVPK